MIPNVNFQPTLPNATIAVVRVSDRGSNAQRHDQTGLTQTVSYFGILDAPRVPHGVHDRNVARGA